MNNTNWVKQDSRKAVFEDILWGKAENKMHAGKVGLIGGSSHGFSSVAKAYNNLTLSGAGSIRMLLPNAIEKTVGKIMPEAEFGPSTPSGSFSVKSLDKMLEIASWADSILIPGDLNKNSETELVLTKFLHMQTNPAIIMGDAVDIIASSKDIQAEEITLVLSISQLQKLAKSYSSATAIVSNMNLMNFIQAMIDLQIACHFNLCTELSNNIIVAAQSRASTTVMRSNQDWQSVFSANASTLIAQFPSKPFEALTTAAHLSV